MNNALIGHLMCFVSRLGIMIGDIGLSLFLNVQTSRKSTMISRLWDLDTRTCFFLVDESESKEIEVRINQIDQQASNFHPNIQTVPIELHRNSFRQREGYFWILHGAFLCTQVLQPMALH